MCVRVLRGRREKRKGALLFMFTAHSDMIAIVQSLTENSLGVVLHTETKADKPTPTWGSFSDLLLFSNTDVFEGL